MQTAELLGTAPLFKLLDEYLDHRKSLTDVIVKFPSDMAALVF